MLGKQRLHADAELAALFDDAGRNIARTSRQLNELLADFPDRLDLVEAIAVGEHEGDGIARQIMLRLATLDARHSMWEPVDVHELVQALDDIVDYAEEAADQLERYGVEAPMECAQNLAGLLVKASDEVAAALYEMRNHGDFSQHLDEIRRLEKAGDRTVRAGVGSLFRAGTDPMVVIRWKDIFETLESALDACETVANVLESMVLKARRV